MIKHIKDAMKIKGNLAAKAIDTDRYVIYLDGEYYGVYDTRRNTFVD